MNWDRVQGNWRQLMGWWGQTWARWRADQPGARAAEREFLAGKLQEAYGIGKENAEHRIKVRWRALRADAGESEVSPRQVDARQ